MRSQFTGPLGYSANGFLVVKNIPYRKTSDYYDCWNLLSVARGSNGVNSDVNRVLALDDNSSVNLASQAHCAGVFIGILVLSVLC
jgi:hypothetical protein